MEEIRLLLVDDHDVVRTGLKTYLQTQPGMQVLAEASSGREALQLLETLEVDVVVMDITMPEMDGLEATRQIKARCLECKVLALTVHADKQYFFEMLAAGADGYVTKQAAAEDLVAAVRAVHQGQVYLQPALAAWLLDDYRRLLARQQPAASPSGLPFPPSSADHPLPDLETLSRRERQVLEYVAEGLTTPEIGKALGLSPKTIARHRERIMNKLDLHSATDLVKFAIRTGLIDVK